MISKKYFQISKMTTSVFFYFSKCLEKPLLTLSHNFYRETVNSRKNSVKPWISTFCLERYLFPYSGPFQPQNH
jgi:hypothetical protein